MQAVSAMRAFGGTDPGLQRDVNEDRFHVDLARGLFIVIDGVGGQAAGGKAADTAVSMLRARLERETGPIASRLREAITVANNEIHRLARSRAEWNGMACVLTAVVVDERRAYAGHVGDTRLYKLRRGAIEKITRDHSPVGEREDAHELSEQEAMRHPRRNEVYRDVGSEQHQPSDPDFIDVLELSFEPDAALLVCSDGLTDLVDSATIHEIVRRWAGRPQAVVKSLIDAANKAGGKDNITAVYVEGDRFAAAAAELPAASEITRRLGGSPAETSRRGSKVRLANVVLIAILIVLTFVSSDGPPPAALPSSPALAAEGGQVVVRASESINDAVRQAPAGTTVVVEPGEYRESVRLKSDVRLLSRVPHGAVIRLPGAASELGAAIVARGVTNASVDGFRIVGDAATPLGTGVLTADSEVSITELQIAGAGGVAIDAGPGSTLRIVAGDFQDNPGSALAVRSGARVAVAHSVFARNGGAGHKTLVVDDRGEASFVSNVFVGTGAAVFTGPDAQRAGFLRDNWLVEANATPRARRATPPAPERRR